MSAAILRVATIALLVCAVLAPAVPVLASTVQELIQQADHLVEAEENFPRSFEQALSLYQQASSIEPDAPLPYLRIARVCLSLGDASQNDGLSRYQQGAQMAEKALALREASADAHFLFAANHGSAVNLLPFWKVSPSVVADLEKHLLRALELDPHHAPANHMMGMLLYRTPGPLRPLLVGKREQVESYLVRSVEADPDFAEARFDLAQYYKDTGRVGLARAQAQKVVTLTNPKPRRTWISKYRPAAEQLLKALPLQ